MAGPQRELAQVQDLGCHSNALGVAQSAALRPGACQPRGMIAMMMSTRSCARVQCRCRHRSRPPLNQSTRPPAALPSLPTPALLAVTGLLTPSGATLSGKVEIGGVPILGPTGGRVETLTIDASSDDLTQRLLVEIDGRAELAGGVISAMGGQVIVELLSLGFDGYLVVTGPSGEVHRNDDAGSTQLSRIGPLTGTGKWRIDVTSNSAGETGAYDLRFIVIPGVD